MSAAVGGVHKFEWKIARTMAHLHMDGQFTGISLPIKSRHAEVVEWQNQVIAALGLPALASTKAVER